VDFIRTISPAASVFSAHRRIRLSSPRILPPLLHPRSDSRPSQQSTRREYENENDRCVFPAVSLEACREDVRLCGVLTDWQVVVKAELFVAVVACPAALRRGFRVVRGWFVGGGGVVEGDDGRVGEAGAFAEGGGCWRRLVDGRWVFGVEDVQAASAMERKERKRKR